MMQARHSFVLEKSQEIKDAIDKSLSLQPQTVVPSVNVKGEAGAVSDAGLSGVFIGALIGLGLAVIQIIREASSQNWFDAFFTVIFGAIIYGIMGVVLGALGGWLVGLVLGFSKNSAKVSSETARQERNQREAQKRRDAEVVEINKKKNLAKDLQSKFETVKAKLFIPG